MSTQHPQLVPTVIIVQLWQRYRRHQQAAWLVTELNRRAAAAQHTT